MISRRHLLLLGGAAALPWPGRAQVRQAPRHALIIGNKVALHGCTPDLLFLAHLHLEHFKTVS